MLAVPDELAHRAKIADWLELKAIASQDGRVGFGTLISATALTENDQEEDIAEEDAEEDRLVEEAQQEIARRLQSVGDGYPFRIEENGQAVSFVRPVTNTGYIYLFCLYLSHAFDRAILSADEAPEVNNEIRDLFQACATVAAGGIVQGPAISFGWPRPGGAKFLKALHGVFKEFRDGMPVKTPRPAASKKIKDNGIDILAWRRTADDLPGAIYLVGQVASGDDWTGKSVVSDRQHFQDYWFERKPSSPVTDAMFMPFALEPELPGDSTAYDEVLLDHVQSIQYKFGFLCYRDRVARYFGDGLRLVEAGEPLIQRHKDLPKIVQWVENYSERLKAA